MAVRMAQSSGIPARQSLCREIGGLPRRDRVVIQPALGLRQGRFLSAWRHSAVVSPVQRD